MTTAFAPFAHNGKFFGIVDKIDTDSVTFKGRDGELIIGGKKLKLEVGQTVYMAEKDGNWLPEKVELKPKKTERGNPIFTDEQSRQFKQMSA